MNRQSCGCSTFIVIFLIIIITLLCSFFIHTPGEKLNEAIPAEVCVPNLIHRICVTLIGPPDHPIIKVDPAKISSLDPSIADIEVVSDILENPVDSTQKIVVLRYRFQNKLGKWSPWNTYQTAR